MSYARFGEGDPEAFNGASSDVYIYFGCDGEYKCSLCCANGGETFLTESAGSMLEHCMDHLRRGDCVPNRAIAGLAVDVYIGDGEELKEGV